MWRQLLLMAICGVLIITRVEAQESTTGEGWQIVKRCVDKASEAEEWTFPGVILAKGWAGLHGIRADLATPYVLALKDNWNPTDQGDLSPDGRWFAITQGESLPCPGCTGNDPDEIGVEAIAVYSTINPDESVSFDWNVHYAILPITGSGRYFFMQSVVWWDNEHLMYVADGTITDIDEEETYEADVVLINPFTQDVSEVPAAFDQLRFLLLKNFFYPSPDWTRFVFRGWTSGSFVLVDLEDNRTIMSDDNRNSWSVAWKPDSSQFIEAQRSETHRSILLTDRNGNTQETLHSAPLTGDFHFMYDEEHAWSPTGKHFALVSVFRVASTGEETYRLHIVDFEEQQIIDTCISSNPWNMVWSPNGQMLAFREGYDFQPVNILDVENWQLHTVTYFEGALIGWREDE